MAQSIQPGRFGHIGRPDNAWLAKQEDELILEPELPIIDTHHHLWDRNRWTYLLPELLADLNSGHNIVATVFEECRSMYRADWPVEMRPIFPDCHVDYYFARNCPNFPGCEMAIVSLLSSAAKL